jgi:hypothetical protein
MADAAAGPEREKPTEPPVGTRSLDEFTSKPRPHRGKRLSRREGSRWAELRREFLSRCDGHRTCAAIERDMAHLCTDRTVRNIRDQMLAGGMISETKLVGQRHRPSKLLGRTEAGDIALQRAVEKPVPFSGSEPGAPSFRSVLVDYAPTVSELREMRRRPISKEFRKLKGKTLKAKADDAQLASSLDQAVSQPMPLCFQYSGAPQRGACEPNSGAAPAIAEVAQA